MRETELERYSGLLKEDAATQTEVDHWRFESETAEAGVISAEAQVSIAKLNLSYTIVTAPFDGRIGRHLVDPGNLVGAMGQQTVLAEIDRIDPLYVYFTINERDLLRISQRRRVSANQPIAERSIPLSFGVIERGRISAPGTTRLRIDHGGADDWHPAIASDIAQS